MTFTIITTGQDEFCEKAEVVAQVLPRWKHHPSYIHTFGITPNYIIFIEQGMVFSMWKIMAAFILKTPFSDAVQHYPEYPVSNP